MSDEIQPSGSGLIRGLLALLAMIVCCGLVWWLGKYLFGVAGFPAIVLTVWTALFVVIGVLVLINFIMGLFGKAFLKW